jgi:hypothetical protein
MSYEINQRITQINQSDRHLNAHGGIQHWTGNLSDTDEGNYNYFNTTNTGNVNAHFFIDSDSISQFVPTDRVANHAREPANSTRWGSEMCGTKDPVKFEEIWKRQVWLWTYLFLHKANPPITKIDKVTLRSHKEENAINHGGQGHQDPDEYFARFGKTMDDMRRDVQKAINAELLREVMKLNWKEILKKVSAQPENWEKAIDTAVKAAKADGNLGDLEIFQYLPTLIEKIFNLEK